MDDQEHNSESSYIKMFQGTTLTPLQEQGINDQKDFQPIQEVQRYQPLSAIIEQDYYVDQSQIIKEINEDKNANLYFLRPPRFSKSTTLSLMANYFDCQVQDSQKNQRLFQEKLSISQYAKTDSHFQNHPIIFLKLDRGYLSSLDKVMAEILRVISAAFVFQKKRRFKKAASSKVKCTEIINNLQQFMKSEETDLLCSVWDCAVNALSELGKMIQQTFKKSCYLMVDGIDYHLTNLLTKGIELTQLRPFSNFLDEMLSQFSKKNKQRRIFITGVLNCFPKKHNLEFQSYDIMSNKYSKYFGFTQKVVKSILKEHFDAQDKKICNILEKCDQYFGGYHISYQDNSISKNKQLLSPQATKRYLAYCIKYKNCRNPQKFVEDGFKCKQKIWFFALKSCFKLQLLRNKLLFSFGLNLRRPGPTGPLLSRRTSVALTRSEKFVFFEPHDQRSEYWLFIILAGFGNISGELGFSHQFFDCFIHNRSSREAYFNGVRQFLSEQIKLDDFSSIDLEDQQLVRQSLEGTLKEWRDNFPSNSKKILQAICSLRIGLCKNKKHWSLMEQNKDQQEYYSEIVIDNCYYPLKKQSVTGVIHWYQNTKDFNNQKEALQWAMWRVLQRNYVSWLINKSNKENNKIQRVILRAICLHSVEKQTNVGIYEIILTLQQANSFNNFFTSFDISSLIQNNKDQNFTEIGKKILKLTRKSDLRELVEHLKNLQPLNVYKYVKELYSIKNASYLIDYELLFPHHPQLVPYFVFAWKNQKQIFELTLQQVKQAGNWKASQQQQVAKQFLKICRLKSNQTYVTIKYKEIKIAGSQPRKKVKKENMEKKDKPSTNRFTQKMSEEQQPENEEESR